MLVVVDGIPKERWFSPSHAGAQPNSGRDPSDRPHLEVLQRQRQWKLTVARVSPSKYSCTRCIQLNAIVQYRPLCVSDAQRKLQFQGHKSALWATSSLSFEMTWDLF